MPSRIRSIATAIALVLTVLVPNVTIAAKPTASATLADITGTARGVALAAETADRFTSYGVPTESTELNVLEYSDGSIIVAPDLLISSLYGRLSADGATSASVDVGTSLVSDKGSTAAPTRSFQVEAASATTYWQMQEQACLASLYVDSARLDSCYYIFKLINDGSTTKSFWTLRQKGTAFEYASGLHSAWVSGERAPNSTSQTWVDFGPEQGHDGACSAANVSVGYIVTLSYSVQACEKWIVNKTCNTCSPWLKNTWDCNCLLGLSAKEGVVSRAVAYQMLVSTSQSATPLFRLGLGMAA